MGFVQQKAKHNRRAADKGEKNMRKFITDFRKLEMKAMFYQLNKQRHSVSTSEGAE
jgi:hypothetical protein